MQCYEALTHKPFGRAIGVFFVTTTMYRRTSRKEQVMARLVTTILLATFAFGPSVVFAHPGHGAEVGVSHFLTDPFHVIAGLAILGGCGALARYFRRFFSVEVIAGTN